MKNLRKKTISLALVFTMLIAMIIPTIVHAGEVHRINTGATGEEIWELNKINSTSEEVPGSTNMEEYINGKKTEFENLFNDSSLDESLYSNLFSTTEGNYKYIKTTLDESDGTTEGIKLQTGEPRYVMIEGVLQQVQDVTITVYFTEVTVTKAPEQLSTISTVDVTIKSPVAGTKIVDENTKPDIILNSNANYRVSWTMYINNYPSVDPSYDDGSIFDTVMEQEKDYYLEVYLMPNDGYEFDNPDNIVLKVNGGNEYELGYCSENQFSFFTKVKATLAGSNDNTIDNDAENKKTYSLTSGDYTAIFSFSEGFDFALKMIDVLKLTEEELINNFNIDIETFNQIKETIINNLKDYGTILGVYAIEIEDSQLGYSDEVTIKIKMTDEMKKFNTFNLYYLDDQDNFKVKEVVNLRIEGEYLVGDLPHLSAYGLVGSNTETEDTKSSSNPKTGDDIIIWMSVMVVSLLGIVGTCKYKEK